MSSLLPIEQDLRIKYTLLPSPADLVDYEWLEKRCCNPFKNHKKQIKGGLKPILLEMSDKAKAILVLTPGKKLCPNCQIQIHKIFPNDDNNEEDEKMKELDTSISAETEKRNINECFSAIEIPPLKTKGFHYSGKAHLGKRKILLQCVKTKVAIKCWLWAVEWWGIKNQKDFR